MATLRPGQSLEHLLTEDDHRSMQRALDAEARGEAGLAWEEHMSGLVVEEALTHHRLRELANLADEAPAWMCSRWAVDQALRWMLVNEDPRCDDLVCPRGVAPGPAAAVRVCIVGRPLVDGIHKGGAGLLASIGRGGYVDCRLRLGRFIVLRLGRLDVDRGLQVSVMRWLIEFERISRRLRIIFRGVFRLGEVRMVGRRCRFKFDSIFRRVCARIGDQPWLGRGFHMLDGRLHVGCNVGLRRLDRQFFLLRRRLKIGRRFGVRDGRWCFSCLYRHGAWFVLVRRRFNRRRSGMVDY